MKIPSEFVIKESDAVLGTTTSIGVKKSGLDPPAKMGKNNEFIALINGYKPIISNTITKLRKRILEHPKLAEYVRSIKIYMIPNVNGHDGGELWIDKKECKHALLFNFFREGYTDDIKLLFDKMEKLDKSISGFAYHYVIGTLYGYRKSSIRGYYLSSYVKKESDWKPFKKSEQYKIYRRDYHKMAKICDEWLEYLLNDSKEFKKYVKGNKGRIELFTL